MGDLVTATWEPTMTDPEHSQNPAEANMTQYQPERENFGGGLPPDPVLGKADEANLAAQEQAEQEQRTQTDGAQAADAEEQTEGGKRRKTTKK